MASEVSRPACPFYAARDCLTTERQNLPEVLNFREVALAWNLDQSRFAGSQIEQTARSGLVTRAA